MKIIYNCYGGSHSSVTSAAIHLGLLDCAQVPCSQDLWKLPYYDTQVKKDHGTLHLMGTDELKNQVYCLGRRNMGNLVKNSLNSMAKIFGIPLEDFKLVDPMPFVNWAMVLGGITSRRLGIIPIGRPIVTWGTKLAFPHLHQLVARVKKDLQPSFPVDIRPKNKKVLIYCDYNGRQLALHAAKLHLAHNFSPAQFAPLGSIVYYGTDSTGIEVYTLGVSYENEMIPKLLRGFAELYSIPQDNLSIIDLTPLGKYSFGVAALLHKGGLTRLAKTWTDFLVKRKQPRLIKVVEKARVELA